MLIVCIMQRYEKTQSKNDYTLSWPVTFLMPPCIYHQHVIPTKFHGFLSVTEKTGRYQEVILAVNNNNIYPRSPLALAVFSGACFSGRRCYGEVTIVKRFIKSLNGLSAATK